MARPKMTKGKREISVRVYLTEQEKDCVDATADKIGVSTASYLRALALADLAKAKSGDSQRLQLTAH